MKRLSIFDRQKSWTALFIILLITEFLSELWKPTLFQLKYHTFDPKRWQCCALPNLQKSTFLIVFVFLLFFAVVVFFLCVFFVVQASVLSWPASAPRGWGVIYSEHIRLVHACVWLNQINVSSLRKSSWFHHFCRWKPESSWYNTCEPRPEQTCLRDFRPGMTQTGLLSYRD